MSQIKQLYSLPELELIPCSTPKFQFSLKSHCTYLLTAVHNEMFHEISLLLSVLAGNDQKTLPSFRDLSRVNFILPSSPQLNIQHQAKNRKAN